MISKLIKHLGVIKEHLGIFVVAIFCIGIFISLINFIFGPIIWSLRGVVIGTMFVLFIFWISTTRY